MEGYGIWYFPNNDIYKGYWKKNEMNGAGIFYYSNGDRYEGVWEKNKRKGMGCKYYNDGRIQKQFGLESVYEDS